MKGVNQRSSVSILGVPILEIKITTSSNNLKILILKKSFIKKLVICSYFLGDQKLFLKKVFTLRLA